MIYLLWTLLNFGLFIFFIVVCFKATRLVREKLGVFAAIILITGLLSFLSIHKNINGNIESPKIKGSAADFVFKETHEITPHTSAYGYQTITSYIGSQLYLDVSFGKEITTGKVVAVAAYFRISGLLGGHIWAPYSVSIAPSPNNGIFTYRVSGTLKWLLLGIPVFSQMNRYEGILHVKDISGMD